ncbi:MAG: hypothetical protein KF901_07830 [Myxococcales bacterium]|nr:hypothetical protein [Myxococcales bacterium]
MGRLTAAQTTPADPCASCPAGADEAVCSSTATSEPSEGGGAYVGATSTLAIDAPSHPVADEPDADEPDADEPDADEPDVETSDAHVGVTGPTIELAGSIGLVFSPRPIAIGLTFGGPRVTIRINDWRLSVSFYPTLLYSQAREEHRLRPGLGFGPEISYKRFVLFAPVYHVEDRFHLLVGLGVRL